MMTTMLALVQAVDDGRTVGEFLASGGVLMYPIVLCSVIVLGLTLERRLALRRRRIVPKRVDAALAAIDDGRLDVACTELEDDRSFGGRVLLAGLRRRGYPLREVESAMEDQAAKEVEKLRRNVRPLVLIGGIAPLLGLLGTVLGIAESFHRVSQAGMGDPEVLAGGIELALTTTIAGLVVAIPAMILAAWLQGRIRGLALWADERIGPAVERMAARPTVAGGEINAA